MKRPDNPAFDQHIADLNKQISDIETNIMPLMMRTLEASKNDYNSFDRTTNPLQHGILALQQEILGTQASETHLAIVMLKEHVQMWEQHKLLSQYVDDAVGESSDMIRTEFHKKQKELIDKYEPIYIGIMKHLEDLKKNKGELSGI